MGFTSQYRIFENGWFFYGENMGDSLNINNLSQGEREALFASGKANQTSASNYVEIAGDTMTGILTGPGLALTSTASVAQAVVYNTVVGNSALTLRENALSGATISPLSISASTASQAVLSISGVFMSTASINLAANKTAFIIPVYHETQRIWGYLAASLGVN